MLESSAEVPIAVLRFPVVLLNRAPKPMAVLSVPLLSFRRAESPSAVLLFGYPPSGAGVTPKAFPTVQQASTVPIRISARRGDRMSIGYLVSIFELFITGLVVVFRLFFGRCNATFRCW